MRQAYIYDLIGSLQRQGIANRVWSYKRSNSDVFPFSEASAFQDESFTRRNIIRLRTRFRGHKSYLSEYCNVVPSQKCVIHGHFLRMGQSVAELKKRFGVPACITAYGSDELFRARMTNELPGGFSIGLRSADVVLAVSNYVLDIVKRFADEKARLWHIGVQVDRYQPVTHTEKAEHTVLSVGRLIKRKGHAFLLRAIPEVLLQMPGTRFKIVGEGPEWAYLTDLAKKLRLGDSLEILPPQPSIREYYAKSDLFVFPSIFLPDGVTEGLGVPLLEAQASCLPVVASKVGGVTDAVDDGQTGYLVEHSNPAKLAESIVRLLSDPTLRRALGKSGREKMKREFDLDGQARELMAVYSSLICAG